MNGRQSPSTLSVSPPLTERVTAEVFEALRMLPVAMTELWRRRKIQRDERRAFDSIAHLNEHVLKDIGAPNWLVARSAERRDVQQRQWVESEFR